MIGNPIRIVAQLLHICGLVSDLTEAYYRFKFFSLRIIEIKWHVWDLVEQLLKVDVVVALVARRRES